MVETKNRGDVAEIILNNPPVNALGKGVREGLMSALKAAEQDNAIKAIVLRGGGRLFSGGADIAEFGKPIAHPQLRSEEHPTELQSLMRIPYAGFGLQKKTVHHVQTKSR